MQPAWPATRAQPARTQFPQDGLGGDAGQLFLGEPFQDGLHRRPELSSGNLQQRGASQMAEQDCEHGASRAQPDDFCEPDLVLGGRGTPALGSQIHGRQRAGKGQGARTLLAWSACSSASPSSIGSASAC